MVSWASDFCATDFLADRLVRSKDDWYKKGDSQ
jgi:hypothetical protein